MINDAVTLEDIQHLKTFYQEELEKLYNRDLNDNEEWNDYEEYLK